MSQQPRRKRSRGRRKGRSQTAPADLWRSVPRLPPPEPIRVVSDPTLLVRSLGEPPLPGQGAVAEHYFGAVLERSASVAVALAASADLLATSDTEDA